MALLNENLFLDKYTDLHPAEIASLLKDLSDDEFSESITIIPTEIIGAVILELPDWYFGESVKSLSTDGLIIAISALESDDQTDFIQQLESTDKTLAYKVFNQLRKSDQAEILQLKQYEEDQAGAYMQTELFSATEDENVYDVIQRFARLRENNELEHIQNLFITNDMGKLQYSIGLDDLLVFNFNKTFKENISTHKDSFIPKSVLDTDDIDEVAQTFHELDLSVIAIVDQQGILLGRITGDDVFDIINESATEQMYHLAGVDDEAEEDESIFKAGKKRAIWLGINLLTAIVASIVISLFEVQLQSLVALAVLMPIVASMGGNAGTQSLTVVVRQLALGDITEKDAKRTIVKELIISLSNGLIFAFFIGIIAAYWFDKGMLGVVIALAMVINLLVAGFFGATIPLLLNHFKVDPAIGSTVILTTVTDVVGFVSFLGLASLILL
ncbi:MAG: magnesium transporter [Thiotrichaceae bacterium]|nr:magnesium transporter [Thiotrichaceae bacterium]